MLKYPLSTIGLLSLVGLFPLLSVGFLDPDLFARMAMGRLIVNTLTIPVTDPFAFTPKNPIWYDHEWLSGLFFYLTFSAGGTWGLLTLSSISCFFTTYLLVHAVRNFSKENSPLEGITLFIGTALIFSGYIWVSLVRSQIFTYLGVSYLLWALSLLHIHRKLACTLFPLVIALWTNLHGGFVVGIGLLTIATITKLLFREKDSRFILIVLTLSIAATLINPYGIGYLEFIINAVSKSRPHIPEWGQLLPTTAQNILVIVVLIAGTITVFSKRKLLPPYFIPITLLTLVFGLLHERLVGLPLFLLAIGLGTTVKVSMPVKKYAPLALFGMSATTIYFLLSRILSPPPFPLSKYPVQSVQWIEQNVKEGKILCEFTQGSFVLWSLDFNRYKISMDGRYEEVYPDKTVLDVQNFFWGNLSKRNSILEQIRPTVILCCRSNAPQCANKELPSTWTIPYDEGDCWVALNKPE